MADAEVPWDVPEGWAWTKLGDLGTWTGGGTPSKSNPAFWEHGTIPWVSPKNMKVDVIGETEDRITNAAVAASATKRVPPGSVLMVMRSGILRHSFPVAVSDRVVTLNQDLRALTPDKGVASSYLARFLSRASHAILDACSKDGTTVNSIDAKALAAFPVPIAPLAEQRRIVARIDELFAEIAEGEAALAEARKGLDVFRRALLKAAVRGELTRDSTSTASLENSNLPRIPARWRWSTVGQVVAKMEYGTSVKCEFDFEGVPVLRMGDVGFGSLSFDRLKRAPRDVDTPILRKGDVVFNRTNSAELVGKCAVYDGAVSPLSLASYLIRISFREEMPSEFAALWINSAYGRRWISEHKSQQVGQANLSGGTLRTMPIPVPPLDEARTIVSLASELSGVSDAEQDLSLMSNDATRLKQSILKAAFEGRLVPQDARDEPASVTLSRLRESETSSPRRRRARASA